MISPKPIGPIDYLVVGHLSCDLTPEGPKLGGTASYSALTAAALGLRVGIVSKWGGEVPLNPLSGVQLTITKTEHSTTFENVQTPTGRVQYIHFVAPDFAPAEIPEIWARTPIVHIGPIAGEGKRLIEENVFSSFLGLTPQGWLRKWDGDHKVLACRWPEGEKALKNADAAVISLEDVGGDDEVIETMATSCPVLAVTEGANGARLYWNGDRRKFRAPEQMEVDSTGAGDIFAAAFFWRLYTTRNPWAATEFATHLASYSVGRSGLGGIPTKEEIQRCLREVL